MFKHACSVAPFTCYLGKTQNSSAVHKPELPDVKARLKNNRRTREQFGNIHWILEETKEFQKTIYLCFSDSTKYIGSVYNSKL